jgi:hypothetical protein
VSGRQTLGSSPSWSEVSARSAFPTIVAQMRRGTLLVLLIGAYLLRIGKLSIFKEV